MYNVEIWYDEYSFKSKMPKLPEKGEKVGFWLGDDWYIKEVDYIVYEFDRKGNYLKAEINLVY